MLSTVDLSKLKVGSKVRVVSNRWGLDLEGKVYSVHGTIINVTICEIFENTGGEQTRSVQIGAVCAFGATEVIAE